MALSKFVFIADVNCGLDEQKDLCDEVGIERFPAIREYHNGGRVVDDYQGSRDFDGMMDYVVDNLLPRCNTRNIDETCSEKAAKYIHKRRLKSSGDNAKEIERLKAMNKGNAVMTPDLRRWLKERVRILKQLVQLGNHDDEL